MWLLEVLFKHKKVEPLVSLQSSFLPIYKLCSAISMSKYVVFPSYLIVLSVA